MFGSAASAFLIGKFGQISSFIPGKFAADLIEGSVFCLSLVFKKGFQDLPILK